MKRELSALQDSMVLMPVEKDTNIKAGPSSAVSMPSQLVHVEKPRVENLRACSVAFLPVTTALTTVTQSNNSTNNPTLLSCQACECYDVLETLMQASGYRIVSPQNCSTKIDPANGIERETVKRQKPQKFQTDSY